MALSRLLWRRGGQTRQADRCYELLSLRQPPVRLLAMICLSIVVRGPAGISSSGWNEIILAVLCWCVRL